MRILVLIKQVPLVWAMKLDPATKTLKREGIPSEVSAFDLRALAKAAELRRTHGGEVIALTMGPPQARKALEECLALGADAALHLCDPAFAGSDTLATARVLAAAIRRQPFDLILCGRHSVDAETGQVGPEIAEMLDLPQVTAARSLDVDGGRARIERETDQGHELVECPLPLLVSACEDLAPEPEASKEEREAARAKPIEVLGAADLGLEPAAIGTAGSPTWVQGLEAIATKRQGKVVAGASLEEAIDVLVGELLERGLFGNWSIDDAAPAPLDTSPVARTGAKDVWVYAEWFAGTLRPVTLELLTKARHLADRLGSEVGAFAAGPGGETFARELAEGGADRVLLAGDTRLAHYDTELHATLLAAAIRVRGPGIVLLPSTAIGRDLAPRVAARLGLGLTGDCLDLELDAEGRLRQLKPAFGGSIVAPILSNTRPEMATVRPGLLPAAPPDPRRVAEIERLELPVEARSRVRLLESAVTAASATELDQAEIVIGAGMGLGAAENVAALRPLAEVLGAAVCTTRDAVDLGWMERQYQVGFTGRSIAPRLYLAIGIRGAAYHMSGVRRAGLIVAINRDAKAPVFKGADLGLVADYAQAVPILTRRLAEAKEARS
jgi:electron transfer flavoprotein alpha subunit